MHIFGKFLVVAGAVLAAVAVAWWLTFYGQLLGEDVKRASQCFYRTTGECAAGNMVISWLGDIPVYQPQLLWLAIAAVVIGLVVTVTAAAPGEEAGKQRDDGGDGATG